MVCLFLLHLMKNNYMHLCLWQQKDIFFIMIKQKFIVEAKTVVKKISEVSNVLLFNIHNRKVPLRCSNKLLLEQETNRYKTFLIMIFCMVSLLANKQWKDLEYKRYIYLSCIKSREATSSVYVMFSIFWQWPDLLWVDLFLVLRRTH